MNRRRALDMSGLFGGDGGGDGSGFGTNDSEFGKSFFRNLISGAAAQGRMSLFYTMVTYNLRNPELLLSSLWSCF